MENNENLLITAQGMLDLFCVIGEIEGQDEGTYRLSKGGVLHKHLTPKLASTTWTSDQEVIFTYAPYYWNYMQNRNRDKKL